MRVLLLSLAVIAASAGCLPSPAIPKSDGGNPAITITEVSPTSGSVSGGDYINIWGTNFVPPAQVMLGGVAATNVIVVSPVRISAQTVNGASQGLVDVKVINGDGQAATLGRSFTFTAPTLSSQTIDDCKIEYPVPSFTFPGGGAPQITFGHVHGSSFIRSSTTAIPGLEGQFGYGDPLADASAWTWAEARFNPSCSTCGGNWQEFSYSLAPITRNGTYNYAYRFRYNGSPWAYCGVLGLWTGDDSVTPGTFTVGAATSAINSCILQYPGSMDGGVGQTSPNIYGRVTANGVTGQGKAAAGMVAQVGFGAQGTDPTSWSTWQTAQYNTSCSGCGSSDEYFGTFPFPTSGNYNYTVRFALQGSAWVYCDTAGETNGKYTNALGRLSVGADVPSCSLVSPSTTAQIVSGFALNTHASVYVPHKTGVNGPDNFVIAQVGIGQTGTPSNSSSWTWTSAGPSGQDSSLTDGYVATIHPALTGNRSVNYRFTTDNGITWTYCNGGYGQAITVVPRDATTGKWCNLSTPASLNLGLTGAPTNVSGEIYISGVTNVDGNQSQVTAQLGYGDPTQDPDVGANSTWTWMSTQYSARDGNNYVFATPFSPLPRPKSGTYGYAYRYYATSSPSDYCYGDLNGSDKGFSSFGQATVQ